MSEFTTALIISTLLTLALSWFIFCSPIAKKRQRYVKDKTKSHHKWFVNHTKDWNNTQKVSKISRNERELHIYYNGGGNKVLSPLGARIAVMENNILRKGLEDC